VAITALDDFICKSISLLYQSCNYSKNLLLHDYFSL